MLVGGFVRSAATAACPLPVPPSYPTHPPHPVAAELGSVDESLRARMAEWFPPGEGGALPPLSKVIVELDSRFLTELMHTAALYAELFEPGGRKRLVKVRLCLCKCVHAARSFAVGSMRVAEELGVVQVAWSASECCIQT